MGTGYLPVIDGKCQGYAGDTDEPCEACKECEYNEWYEEGAV